MDIIVSSATHRAGSTLLQRICNARKGTLVWGEHGGVIHDFVRIYNSIKHFSEYSIHEREAYKSEGTNAWIASMTPELEYVEDALIKSVQTLLDNLYSQHKSSNDMIGFKEVRYGKEELELLRKCYPEAEILLLVRHPVDCWQSAPDWYENMNHLTDKWNANAAYYMEMAKSDPKAHLVYYEDLVNRDEKTLELISNVAKVTRQEAEHVLKRKLRSTRRESIPQEEIDFILKECSEVMELHGYK